MTLGRTVEAGETVRHPPGKATHDQDRYNYRDYRSRESDEAELALVKILQSVFVVVSVAFRHFHGSI